MFGNTDSLRSVRRRRGHGRRIRLHATRRRQVTKRRRFLVVGEEESEEKKVFFRTDYSQVSCRLRWSQRVCGYSWKNILLFLFVSTFFFLVAGVFRAVESANGADPESSGISNPIRVPHSVGRRRSSRPAYCPAAQLSLQPVSQLLFENLTSSHCPSSTELSTVG